MARTVDETEWLTRSTAPLRLARYVQTTTSSRKLQILSCAACRLIEHHLRRPELLDDLLTVERFAFGELSGADYYDSLSAVTTELHRTHRQYGEDISPIIAATRAIAAAGSGNVVAGMLRTFEWVLIAGKDDANLPTFLCDLVREIVGNPFRLWRIQSPWLATGMRFAPDGTSLGVSTAAFELATIIDSERRFELLPILADELETTGWADPGILHHCRNGKGHRRGCWAVDVVLGRE